MVAGCTREEKTDTNDFSVNVNSVLGIWKRTNGAKKTA